MDLRIRYLIFITMVATSLHCGRKYGEAAGYRFLDKADEAIARREFNRAERYIYKARRSNYGTCGESYVDAYSLIDRLLTRSYIDQHRYDDALRYLDSTETSPFGGVCGERATLRVEVLTEKFGATLVAESFAQVDSVKVGGADAMWPYTADLARFEYAFKFGCGTYRPDESCSPRWKADTTAYRKFEEVAVCFPFYDLVQKSASMPMP